MEIIFWSKISIQNIGIVSDAGSYYISLDQVSILWTYLIPILQLIYLLKTKIIGMFSCTGQPTEKFFTDF